MSIEVTLQPSLRVINTHSRDKLSPAVGELSPLCNGLRLKNLFRLVDRFILFKASKINVHYEDRQDSFYQEKYGKKSWK